MDIMQALGQVASSQYLLWMGLITIVDLITGVVSALLRKTFDLNKLGDLFPHNILMMIMAVGAQVLGEMQNVTVSGTLTTANLIDATTFTLFMATLAASVYSNLKEILTVLAATKPAPAPTPPPKP